MSNILNGGGTPGADFLGAQFGLMNNLRTGNIILDTAICMAIPLLFGMVLKIFEHVRIWWDVYGHQFATWTTGHEYRRVITYERLTTTWGQEVPSPHSWNNLLQKAVTLYNNKHYSENKLKVLLGAVSLMTVEHRTNQYGYHDESDGNNPADQLKKYRMTCEPDVSVWSELEPGLFFLRMESADDERGGANSSLTRTRVTFTFRCRKPNGDEVIQNFLDRAYAYYQDELKKQQDNSRYFYCMVSTSSSGGGGDGGGDGQGGGLRRTYKRYKLSDEKTFKSLFFPEKDQLLHVLKHFTDKTGKYEIEGYPHKLGLLLFGPPGTGKTSLIKAMAAHTKRHIVNIPLSRIKTNQELMDLVFDQVFQVAGEDLPQRLGFKDVIFVMEDVDAASSIVLSRKASAPVATSLTKVTITRETSVNSQHQDPLPLSAGVGRSISGAGGITSTPVKRQISDPLALVSSNSVTSAGGDAPVFKVKRETTLAREPELISMDSPLADDDDDEGPLQGPEGLDDAELLKAFVKGDKGDKEKKSSSAGKDDKLDLAGLLNVLDGVIDCPGRIVIMTSNHPEKLDEALIRPGRIDKKILLDYLQCPQAIQMVQHYFQKTLTEEERQRMSDIFKLEPKLTPAVLEQLCAEHEEVHFFLQALDKQARKKPCC